MIRSFKDTRTEAVFAGKLPRGFPQALFKRARNKLLVVNAAEVLDDLKVPPSNKLHPLVNDRVGQHAIWINDQYRICFRWTDVGPEEVEITDHHYGAAS